ncbi:hypothetical protein ABK040_016709 [Willaertia magna]
MLKRFSKLKYLSSLNQKLILSPKSFVTKFSVLNSCVSQSHSRHFSSSTIKKENYKKKEDEKKEVIKVDKKEVDMAEISRNAVIKAIMGNTFITAIKFVAYLASGSASLLAETAHSLIDSLNQGLLYLGIKQSAKTPDSKYQYGYGRARYFYSLVSALGIFWIGSFSVIYSGIQNILHIHNHSHHTSTPHEVHHSSLMPSEDIDSTSLSYRMLSYIMPEQCVNTLLAHYGLVTPVVLLVSFLIDGGVLTSVIKDIKEQKPEGMSVFQYIRSIQDPMVLSVLLEDIAACLGIIIAFAGIGLSVYTDNLIYDALASVTIGGLLGIISASLIELNRKFLIGRSIDSKMEGRIRTILMKRRSIEGVYAIQSQWLSPNSFSVNVEVDFNGHHFAKVLRELGYEREFIKRSKDPKELMKLLNWYTEDVTKALEREIIDIEEEIRQEIPEATYIEVEPSSSLTSLRIVEMMMEDTRKD